MLKSLVTPFLVSLFIINITYSLETYNCTYNSGIGTFNLCDAIRKPTDQYTHYHVTDSKANELDYRNFSYAFNICADMNPPNIPNCYNTTARYLNGLKAQTGYCPKIGSDGSCLAPLINIDTDTGGYQLKSDPSFCYRLHDGITPPKFSLLSNDPTKGIMLTYKNGDFCSAYGKNRELNLLFICDINNDEGYNVPDIEKIYETSDDICSYFIEIETFYGCPIECPIINNKLCDNKGICGFDYTISQPKCFCYGNYIGEYCQNIANYSYTPAPTPVTTKSNNLFPDYDGCMYELNDKNGITAHYDLTPFNLVDKVFDVDDKETYKTYQYKWNICGKIPDTVSPAIVPSSCWAFKDTYEHGPCLEPGDNNTCSLFYNSSDKATAVQVDTNDGDCFWLSTQIPSNYLNHSLIKPNYNISLYDNDNAGLGIKLTLNNGDYCNGYGVNRQLIINLICPDTKRNSFLPEKELNIDETVFEDPICTYSLFYESPLACPKHCITTNLTGGSNNAEYGVCNNHGICSADIITGHVHCLCDTGYTGDQCELLVSGFIEPTKIPTQTPSKNPTKMPTKTSDEPTGYPSKPPTMKPTYYPSINPTNKPTENPTNKPNFMGKHNTNSGSGWMILSITLIIIIVLVIIGVVATYFMRKSKGFSQIDENGVSLTAFETIN